MEYLPRALDNILGVLLCDFTISSWKIAANGPNPTVVLRLSQTSQSREHGDRPQTTVYRKKPPSQLVRDRKRAAQFYQRCDRKVDSERIIPCDLRENTADVNTTEDQSARVQNSNIDRVYMCSDTVTVPSAIDPHLSREDMRFEDTECTGDVDSLAIGGAKSKQEMDQQSGKSVDVTGGTCGETGYNADADATLPESVLERDSASVSLERERSVFESTPRTGDLRGQTFDIDSRGDSKKTVRPPGVIARGRLSLKKRGRVQDDGGGREGFDRKTVTNTTDNPSRPPPSGACDSSKNSGPSSNTLSQDEARQVDRLLAKMDAFAARGLSINLFK